MELESKLRKKVKKKLIIAAIPIVIVIFMLSLTFGAIALMGSGSESVQNLVDFKISGKLLEKALEYEEQLYTLRQSNNNIPELQFSDLVLYGILNSENYEEYETDVLGQAFELAKQGINPLEGNADSEIKKIVDNVTKSFVGQMEKLTTKVVQGKVKIKKPVKQTVKVKKFVKEIVKVPMKYYDPETLEPIIVYIDEEVTKEIEVEEEQIIEVEVEEDGETTIEEWSQDRGLRIVYPIPNGYKSTGNNDFGAGRSYGGKRSHEGNDIIADKGTPIVAIETGTIENIGWNELGGWRIGIRSLDGNKYYYYAHMEKYADGMKKGMKINAGQLIGFVGDSGYGPEGTTGMFVPHLHFQLGVKGIEGDEDYYIDPYQILKFLESHKVDVNKAENGSLKSTMEIRY